MSSLQTSYTLAGDVIQGKINEMFTNARTYPQLLIIIDVPIAMAFNEVEWK
jgi:hypothetical protein